MDLHSGNRVNTGVRMGVKSKLNQLIEVEKRELPGSNEVVEARGLEPLTLCLQSRCSPN